jgi:acetyl-CoA carboxylase biotin carboxyl carrier protein
MEYDKILELMDKMEKSSLTCFEYSNGDEKLRFEKQVNVVAASVNAPVSQISSVPNITIVEPITENSEKGKIVKSPIVGTFYAASSPDAAAFVSVGQTVKKGDILCIVEAMKMMNEIECEFEGVVSEILVANGQLVEYGQSLFVIS